MKLLLLYGICLGSWTLLTAQITLQWQKTFGGTSLEFGYDVVSTADGGCAFVGQTFSNGSGDVGSTYGGGDAWVVKLDAQKNIEWQAILGGWDSDELHSIISTSDGGYLLAGQSSSNDRDLPANYGNYDVWVVKLDALGNTVWSKNFGGTDRDQAFSLAQTTDGNYLIGAQSASDDGDVASLTEFTDWWLIKLDNAGAILWKKTYGGSSNDALYQITNANDGGFAIIGSSSSNNGDISGQHGEGDYWVVKFDSIGNLQWQRALGGSATDEGRGIKQCPDRGFLVTGFAGSSNSGDIGENHGAIDAWVIKLSADGAIEWQKTFGGSDYDWLLDIEFTDDGGYLLSGFTLSIDGQVLDNDGYQDLWVVKLNANGKLLDGKTFGGMDSDFSTSIARATNGNYFVMGQTQADDGDVEFNHGWQDVWLLEITEGTVDAPTPAWMIPQDLLIHPNPVHSTLSVNWPENATELSIQITDLAGKIVQSSLITPGNKLNVEDLPNGAYLLRATDNSGKISVGKFVKQ